MIENLIGDVSMAIHEDRLARALKNVQVAEAMAQRKSARGSMRGQIWQHIATVAAHR